MLGTFCWSNGRLHLRPGPVDPFQLHAKLGSPECFSIGAFSISEYESPAFDAVLVQHAVGDVPSERHLRFMIRNEIMAHGREERLQRRVAATSEDTESAGQNVGFLREPKSELYPPLFQGSKTIPVEVRSKLKSHVLNVLELEFVNPDQWIYFTIYGSGISYNWDEGGDLDLQMWVDHEKYMAQENEDLTVDDLIAAVRRNVQQVNFPSFKDLGLESPAGAEEEADGSMLIQYYPKPGKGTPEENLASKPYACYDLETDEWLEEPEPIEPTFYGEQFVLLLPKAEDIALQAEALIAEYERDILNWQFWFALDSQSGNPSYKDQMLESKDRAEQEKAGIKTLFDGVFQGRAKAYSPEGKGIEDERDMIQKLLEVWGIFQKLKHFAREPLPWDEQKMPDPPEKTSFIRQANFVIYSADIREIADKMLKRIMEQYAAWMAKAEKQDKWMESQGYDQNERDLYYKNRIAWFIPMMSNLMKQAPETYKLWPWLFRAWKKLPTKPGDPQLVPAGHVIDILRGATQHLDKLRDNPQGGVPDVMQAFQGFDELEAWVYERNAEMVAEGEEAPNRDVFEFPDGWKIVQVHPDNLNWEGEQMGHCVGSYCNAVMSGRAHIFSLRDPKGFPHVTIEIQGQAPPREQIQWQGETLRGVQPQGPPAFTKTDKAWEILQIQGKENQEPNEKYKNYIKQWFSEIQKTADLKWGNGLYSPYRQEDISIADAEDLEDWYAYWQERGGWRPKTQRDPQYENEYGVRIPDPDVDISEVSVVEKVADSLMELDSYGRPIGYVKPDDMSFYVENLWEALIEHYGSEEQAKHQLGLAIQRGFEHVDNEVQNLRDQNWDYEFSMMRDEWNMNETEDFDDWWESVGDDDPYSDPRYEMVQDAVADEMEKPFQYAYKWLRELSEKAGMYQNDMPQPVPPPPAPMVQPAAPAPAPTPEGNESGTLELPGTFSHVASEETDQLAEVIRSSGGGTFDYNLDPVLRDNGYFVSVKGHEQVIPIDQLSEVLESYIGKVGEFMEEDELFLGAWVENDQVYLDISRWFENKEEAIDFGRANDQRAIWDIKNNDSLYINQDRVAALTGLPQSAFGPNPDITEAAQMYVQNQGIDYQPPQEYIPVDPNRARAIADEYDRMEHNPNDPNVKASYDAFKAETLKQYEHLVNNGFVMEFYPDNFDPYPKGPRQALEDIRDNKHLYVYPTDDGFGSSDNQYGDHPLLEQTGLQWNGKPVTYNDVFRGVHDVFGHGKEGVGFRWDGEDNAWRQHAAMYSELAKPAMTAETRGQNSWVNFGPHGETNQTANQQETIYADQKAGILPEWVHKDSEFTTPAGGFGAFSFVQKTAEPGYPSPEHRDPGGWAGIMEKAQRLRTDGQVQVQLNAPDHVLGVVQGDHGTYQTELWRDDPNAQAITLWDCDCQWEDYSWGRTRQFKKYEGRPCSHTLALYWESMATPLDTDAYFGDEEGQMPLPQEYLPAGLPGGQPAPQGPPQSVPVAPQPGQQLTLPGTFSSVQEPQWRLEYLAPKNYDPHDTGPERAYDFQGQDIPRRGGITHTWNLYDEEKLVGTITMIIDAGYVLNERGNNFLHIPEFFVSPEYRNTDAFFQLTKPVLQFVEDADVDLHASIINDKLKRIVDRWKERRRGSWYKSSVFHNGDYVRLNRAMEGYDEDGGFHRVPRNKIAEVIWSDEMETIAIVSTELGRLEAHNIRLEAPTSDFSLVPRTRGTAPRRTR